MGTDGDGHNEPILPRQTLPTRPAYFFAYCVAWMVWRLEGFGEMRVTKISCAEMVKIKIACVAFGAFGAFSLSSFRGKDKKRR